MQDVIKITQEITEYIAWRNKQGFWKNHKKRLANIVRDNYNHRIKKIVKEDSVKEFSVAKITKYAFTKMDYIAKRVSKLASKPLEIYMYLTSKLKNNDKTIRDVYIGREQSVSQYQCDISGRGQIDSEIDIKENLNSKILAWGHSHGSLIPFHSAKDDDNIINFVNLRGIEKKIKLFENFKLNFHYFPSIVLNEKSDNPYCAIAVKYPQLTEKGIIYKEYIKQNCLIDIIEDEKQDLDKELIDAQILDNVSYGKRKLLDIYSGGNLKIKQDLLSPLSGLPKISRRSFYTDVKNKIKNLIKKY